MRQIFVDMDGVVADLDGFYLKLTGKPSPKLGGPESKSFWRVVNTYHKYHGRSFYEDLPILPDAIQLMDGIKQVCPDPIFLTGGGDPTHPETTEGKRRWVDRYFGQNQKMICCKSREKCKNGKSGDVLIDDWIKYRHLWEEMGGIFILHDNAIKSLLMLSSHFS